MKQGDTTSRSAPCSRTLQRGTIWLSRGSGSVLGLVALSLLGCTSSVSGGPEDGAGGAPEAASAGTGSTSAGTGSTSAAAGSTSAGTGAGTAWTPCEERLSQEACEAQTSDDDVQICSWELVSVSPDGASCDALTEEHRCLGTPRGGPGGCPGSVECGQEDGLPLLYRQVGGTVELHRFDGVCGLSPVGWRYCIWGSDGTLAEGPSACACACREGE
ncbi:hypothetical protein [Sorangium sp. So ce341]|uniref:hypothetical protein n=1 Tax=Sorangium sp. So ce341 TaxID=3133302 RepID=UPI003F63BCDB